VKDYRQRRLDTVLGQITVQAPRFEGCPVCDQKHVFSPISRLLPRRVLPELHHLQARLATELPHRQATAFLRELLPSTGGLTAVTTRRGTLAVGQRMEQELCHEGGSSSSVAEPAEHLTVGIDGAFVKARCSVANQRHHFEVLTGRVEWERGRGQAFAVVRDRHAKQEGASRFASLWTRANDEAHPPPWRTSIVASRSTHEIWTASNTDSGTTGSRRVHPVNSDEAEEWET
jgi:hypothetical protein